eukprot:COSAG02_NODE_233_length_27847_cov_20.383055_4_plen_410_part_00
MVALDGGAEQSEGPSLGCSMHEFVDPSTAIPPLEAYVDELAGFGAACRAAAEAVVKSSRRKGGAPTVLRRQAARDADMLLLAEWWNELLDQHDELVGLLFGARAELRASSPSGSVLRAQVHQAAQKYLSVAQQATAAAHADLLAAQRQTDGPRLGVLQQVLSAAAVDSNVSCTMRPVTWFSAYEPDARRDAPPVALAETTSSAADERLYDCHPETDSDLVGAEASAPLPEPRDVAELDVEGAVSTTAAGEMDGVTQDSRANDHDRGWVPAADMNSLPRHMTLDPQQKVVPTVTAFDMQAHPPMFTMKAAAPVVDEVGAVQPSVRGEPIAYLEELAEPPRHGKHTDREALRQCQDDYWDRENDGEGSTNSDSLRDEAEEQHDSHAENVATSAERDRLTVPVWARATLLDC